MEDLQFFDEIDLWRGSLDQTWVPEEVFGGQSKFAPRCLIGELNVKGFDVSHTKDGIDWGDYEEVMCGNYLSSLDDLRCTLLTRRIIGAEEP